MEEYEGIMKRDGDESIVLADGTRHRLVLDGGTGDGGCKCSVYRECKVVGRCAAIHLFGRKDCHFEKFDGYGKVG